MPYKVRIFIFITLFTGMMHSCATFYPEYRKEKTKVFSGSNECELVTRKLRLNHKVHNGTCSGNNLIGLLICAGISGAYTATTAVISGSIVLTGNTIHWLEKQGNCNPEELSDHVNEHTKPLEKLGGKRVTFEEE